MKLEVFHVNCVVLFDGPRHMGHGRGNYEKQGWAQVDHVDPTWTNYGQKELILGFKFNIKLMAFICLKKGSVWWWNTCIKWEKTTLTVFYLRPILPTTLMWIHEPKICAGSPWIVTIGYWRSREVWLLCLLDLN